MSEYVRLDLVDLGIGLGFVAVAAVIAWYERFGVFKDLLWGTVRACVQLAGVGFVLTAVFELEHPAPMFGVITLMTIIAGHTATKRIKLPLPNKFAITTIAIAVGSAFVLAYTLAFVLDVRPWFDPRYLIPLAGIVIAFAMNAVALAAERLTEELVARRGEVEAVLALGGSPRRAAQSAIEAALRTSWTPLLNHLMVVGIVQLPGMMTGQIIAGASPLDAVRYQILIAFMLSACVAVSTACAVELIWRRAFNDREQLTLPG